MFETLANININCILLALTNGEWIGLSGLIISAFTIVFGGGKIFERINNIKKSLDDLKPDINEIPEIRVKVSLLWADRFTKSESPMVLNEKGIKILKDSKIEELTDKYYSQIIEQLKSKKCENAYQAQESLIEIVKNYKNIGECKNHLENAAFLSGVDVDTILFAAAINIRDKAIKELQFEVHLSLCRIDNLLPHQQAL